jgi:hypothetical protein
MRECPFLQGDCALVDKGHRSDHKLEEIMKVCWIASVLVGFGVASGISTFAGAATPKPPKPCSTEKVNGDCYVIVDRTNPLQLPTLQMYPGKTVEVRIQNGLPFELVSLDWQNSTASLTPDPSNAILTALDPALAKAEIAIAHSPGRQMMSQFRGRVQGNSPEPPDQCKRVDPATTSELSLFYNCAAQLHAEAKEAARQISAIVNPDSLVFPAESYPSLKSPNAFNDARVRLLCRVFGQGSSIPAGVYCDKLDPQPLIAYHDMIEELAKFPTDSTKYLKIGGSQDRNDLLALASYLSGVVTPLVGIGENLLHLDNSQPGDGVLGYIVDPRRSSNPANGRACNSAMSEKPKAADYASLLQRQVSCGLNVINLVANSVDAVPTAQQKKSIVVITANYTDARVETSAGIMLSILPSRSFAAVPQYSGAPPTVTEFVVTEADTRPLVVPYAAAHVRLGNDWAWGRTGRRGAVYATFLTGVNPNTTTADFGAGLSVSWRALMLSPVAHFAHDVRLTGGFTPNESLGASFSGSVPTEHYWTTSFGLGIGVRLPLIPGR